MSARIRLVGWACLGALAVAACSNDPGQPTVLGTGTRTPSVATTSPSRPSPTLLPRPAHADDYSTAGMKAFTRYAITAFNRAYSDGDVATLKAISTRNCQTCRNVERTVSRIWGTGGRTAGGLMTELDLGTAGPVRNVLPTVSVDMTVTAFKRYDKAGKVLEWAPAHRIQLLFDLARKGDTWWLDGVRRGSPL